MPGSLPLAPRAEVTKECFDKYDFTERKEWLVEENERVVRAFLDTVERGASIAAMLTEDFTWYIPGKGRLGGRYTRDELGKLLGPFFAMIEGPVRFSVNHVTAQDDRVAVDCESYAAMRRGGEYRNTYHFLFRLREGRIFEIKEFLDTGYMEQLLADEDAARVA